MNYPHPTFPGGIVVTVLRGSDRNWEGDPSESETTHRVGPCDVKWGTDTEDNTDGEQLVLSARVTAPHGSDVQSGDRIRFPDGRVFVIDGQVRETPNPFTGWSTGVRFTIAKDGTSGLRRS